MVMAKGTSQIPWSQGWWTPPGVGIGWARKAKYPSLKHAWLRQCYFGVERVEIWHIHNFRLAGVVSTALG